MNVIFGIMDQCDTKIDLIMYSQVGDLHFVVQMILPYIFFFFFFFTAKQFYLNLVIQNKSR